MDADLTTETSDITLADDTVSLEELQLAARNHGMPLEALRWDQTPVGLHYLLMHFDIPTVEPDGWRLSIGGLVGRELTLGLDDLRARPALTLPVTMECAGNGRTGFVPRPRSQPWVLEAIGTATWTGTPLRPLLEEAGLADGALEVVFTGLDHGVEGGIEHDYERSLPVEEALREDLLLAYEVNGQPLPPQHGAPLRLVVPGWYGMTSVKWLTRITVVDEPFRGYQQVKGYRFRTTEEDPGRQVTRIQPRSLMVPPGFPEFMTRDRVLPPGATRIEGKAWSGWGPIERVEVSVDGGTTWHPAELGQPASAFAWTPWWFDWEPAGPGEFELSSRATDAAGNQQPLTPVWNVGGYENNSIQRVLVTVQDRTGGS